MTWVIGRNHCTGYRGVQKVSSVGCFRTCPRCSDATDDEAEESSGAQDLVFFGLIGAARVTGH